MLLKSVVSYLILLYINRIQFYSKIIAYYHFGLIEADADDNKFVDCAIAADAEYIVTNDTHFNILKHIDWPKLNVIAIKEFAKQL